MLQHLKEKKITLQRIATPLYRAAERVIVLSLEKGAQGTSPAKISTNTRGFSLGSSASLLRT
jgi:hypothetical protein